MNRVILGAKLAGAFPHPAPSSSIHPAFENSKLNARWMLDAGWTAFCVTRNSCSYPSRIQHPAGTIIVARNYSHWNPYRTRSSKPWQPPLHTTTFPWSYGNDFPAIDRQPPLLHLVILSTRFNRWFSVDGPSYSADFNSVSITNTDDDHRQPLTTSWIE